ncbi:recombinase family protein [Lachnospiraceae bacterium LCP25S3_G4]
MRTGALYIRVSSDDQLEFSPAAQERALMEYAVSNEIIVTKQNIFIDEGISGRKAEQRPAFMQMIATAKRKPKPFDLILVHKFDRFSRSREDSIVYKSLLRKEYGIQVISVTEHIEDDKFSVILEAMLEAMAEYYSLNLSDEVLKGMTEKARRGQYQTAPPLGYDMVEKKLIINKDESKIVSYIYKKFLSGMSPYAITCQLNSMGFKTKRGNAFETRAVTFILTNPIYCGYAQWNGIRKPCNNETIIDRSTYDIVQNMLVTSKRPKRSRPPETLTHWLTGLLYCSSCGGKLSSGGHKNGNFQCSAYTKGKCPNSHSIMYHKISTMVIDALQDLQNSDNTIFIPRTPFHPEKEIAMLDLSLAHIAEKEKRITDAYINGVDSLDEYKQHKLSLSYERENYLIQIENLKSSLNIASTNATSNEILGICDLLKSDFYSKEQKHAALSSIFNKIVYDKSTESLDFILTSTLL